MCNFKRFSGSAIGILSFLASSNLVFSSSVQAATLDLSSWTKVGDVGITANQANISTAAGIYSGNDPVLAGGSIESNLSLNPGDLDNPDDPFFGTASEGSAITTNLNVRKGDRLIFDWNFLTNDTFDDYAFFVANGIIAKFASVSDASNSSVLFNSETGQNTFTYTFKNAGNYQVGIGVVDVGDFSNTSALQISNVQTKSVPESSTILGIGLVAGFGVMFRRKRSKKQV